MGAMSMHKPKNNESHGLRIVRNVSTGVAGTLFVAGMLLAAGGCETMHFPSIVIGSVCLVSSAIISNLFEEEDNSDESED